MAVREILQLGDPRLWQPAAAVEDPRMAAGLVRDLAETLASFRARRGFGRGIAAPQLGVLERVLFLRVPGGFEGALVNPVVEQQSAERMELWDDCFSFPDLMVRVERAARVEVCFRDEQGAERRLSAQGGLAELLQHEIDHLDGVLAVDRAVSPRAFATRAEWERRLRARATASRSE
jgi:peptide deformylase